MTKPCCRGRAVTKLANNLISIGKDFTNMNRIEQPWVVEWQLFLLNLDRHVDQVEPTRWKSSGYQWSSRRRGGSAVLGADDNDLSRNRRPGATKRCLIDRGEPTKSLREHYAETRGAVKMVHCVEMGDYFILEAQRCSVRGSVHIGPGIMVLNITRLTSTSTSGGPVSRPRLASQCDSKLCPSSL